MNEIEIRILSPEQARDVFDAHMHRDFPADELKPWEIMHALYRRGSYAFLGAFLGDDLAGYAWLFCPGEGCVLIDYLAVLPELRGRGIGAGVLDALADYCRAQGSLLLESEYPGEAPDEQIARRRLGFYRRAGFADTGVQVRLFGVRFCILAHGGDADARGHMESLYRAMLTEQMYRENVQFL